MRHFGTQALIEDNSLRGQGSTLTNVRLAYRIDPHPEIALDVFNLLDRKVDDIQYAYASRLPGEPAFNEATRRRPRCTCIRPGRAWPGSA